MRTSRSILLISGCMMSALLAVHCGDGDSKPPLATLDSHNAEALAQHVGQGVPGCDFVSSAPARAAVQQDPGVLPGIKAAFTLLAAKATVRDPANRMAKAAAYDINEEIQGECGGSFATTGTHDSGTTSLTIAFNDYCMPALDGDMVVSGSMAVVQAGHPSDTGPVMEEIRLSTKGNGIVVTETTEGQTRTHRLVADNLKYSMGNPGGTASAAAPDVLTIKRLKISEDGQDMYDLQDVRISTWPVDEEMAVQIDKATYTDSAIGAVTLESDTMIIGESWQGALTITGDDGTSMTVTPDPSGDGLFALTQDGASIGTLDCTSLADEELPELEM